MQTRAIVIPACLLLADSLIYRLTDLLLADAVIY
jgi:hypothetical protein